MSGRDEVDLMALRYLRDHGPDELGTINTEEQFAAAMLYCDLKKEGLVDSRSPKRGVVYWDITPAGVAKLEGAA